MKVVSSEEMVRLEKLAFEKGASGKHFMEKAGKAIGEKTLNFLKEQELNHVILLCGKGNNGGDAYVAGRYLLEYSVVVEAIQLFPIQEASPLCQENHQQFLQKGGKVLSFSPSIDCSKTIFLDGILGTGFQGKLQGILQECVTWVNASQRPVLSIDIPSGLNGTTGEGEGIQATKTFFLGLPKKGFFLPNGWQHVGKLEGVDFGLDPLLLEQADASFSYVTKELVQGFLPPISSTRHKYQAGCVLGFSGSKNMPGAAFLSSLAAMRSGAGIVFLLSFDPIPVVPEVLLFPFNEEKLQSLLSKAQAVYLGPGIGQTEEAIHGMEAFLERVNCPCVLDADALNILASKKLKIPSNSILTPHFGEMKRLLGVEEEFSEGFLEKCASFAKENACTLVLKGGPTWIFHQDRRWVSSKGTPGMATAGSGDVLTGILAALLAQGCLCEQGALLGVYLHGLCGEYASSHLTDYSLMASDIIESLPKGFCELL